MRLFILVLTLVSLRAEARTQVIFSADGSKATAMLISMTGGDGDANTMFQSLNVAPEEVNGKLTKRAAYDNAAGERVFSVVCVMSAFVPTNGTCTLVLANLGGAVVDKNSSVAGLELADSTEAQKAASAFVLPADKDFIYASGDQKLSIAISRGANSVVSRFRLDIR